MSRTVRRKGKAPEWVTHGWYWENGLLVWKPLPEDAQKKAIARYHSDQGIGNSWPVPKWYKKLIEQRRRKRDKMIIAREHLVDYEETHFPGRPRNHGCYW